MSRTPTAARKRGSLSEQEILDGAQQIVEDHGLQQLSMPALAKHLGSGVTSIYWYFRSKDELVAALTNRVSREMYGELPPVGDRPWDEELFAYFKAFRDLIEANTVYREVFAYRGRFVFRHAAMAPTMFRRLEAGLALLVDAGLTPAQAARAYSACTHYTRGFVVVEHALDREDAEADGRPRPAAVDHESFPLVSRLGGVDPLTNLDDDQFALGLRLIIDGIKREYTLP